MISILLVDEDFSLVEGIRETLFRKNSGWRLEHVQTGTEALETLFKSKFDIVVTESHLPDMDGVTLLNHVHAKHSTITRFILGSSEDAESLTKYMSVAHQFVLKPFTPTDLVSILDRASNFHLRIQSEFVRRLVGNAKHVPSAPKTAMKIANMVASGEASMRSVAEIIENDPGLSVRVLQVANSAMFRISREVKSVPDALSYIGFECAKALAIANEAFRITPENKFLKRLIEETCDKAFWGATMVSRFLDKHPMCETAMTGALIRDVGILISANANPRIYKVAMDPQFGVNSLVDVERTCLGITHAEIGGNLLAQWGIPMPIAEIVTYHHAMSETLIEPKVMAAIHVADTVAEYPLASLNDVREAINWLFIDVNDLRDEVEAWLELDLRSFKLAA